MDGAVGDDGTIALWISYSALAKFPVDDREQAKETEFDTLPGLALTDPDITLPTDE
jgi:hypothetical protein